MPDFSYTRDIPDAPNNPSVDQPKMEQNFNSIDSLIAVDHFSFNDNNGGYHNVIHQFPQISTPGILTGFNEVYTQTITPNATAATSDTQLFTQSSAGVISQLTGSVVTTYVVAGVTYSEGYQWLGGILYQWGYSLSPSINGRKTYNITFKDRQAGMIPFPNNCFLVVPSLIFTSTNLPGNSDIASTAIATNLTTNLGFTAILTSPTSKFLGISWMAVGN